MTPHPPRWRRVPARWGGGLGSAAGLTRVNLMLPSHNSVARSRGRAEWLGNCPVMGTQLDQNLATPQRDTAS